MSQPGDSTDDEDIDVALTLALEGRERLPRHEYRRARLLH